MIFKQGSKTAREIYEAVGVALSYWESSEDVVRNFYKRLMFDINEGKIARFVKAHGRQRHEMVAKAVGLSTKLNEAEKAKVLAALELLGKLAEMRNKITHGYVTFSNIQTEHETFSGNYLVPAWSEYEPGDRELRFALTAADINDFTQAVRIPRGDLMDIDVAISQRTSAAYNEWLAKAMREQFLKELEEKGIHAVPVSRNST